MNRLFPMSFQSTLPRGERQVVNCYVEDNPLFQSTLPRGERLLHIHTPSPPAHFNPRSHVGGDRKGCPCIRHLPYFNPRSHAGSDDIQPKRRYIRWGFQSTLPRGERLHGLQRRDKHIKFQSTLPRGERPGSKPAAPVCKHFNPRSHAGSDCGAYQNNNKLHISIHAPTRGATYR